MNTLRIFDHIKLSVFIVVFYVFNVLFLTFYLDPSSLKKPVLRSNRTSYSETLRHNRNTSVKDGIIFVFPRKLHLTLCFNSVCPSEDVANGKSIPAFRSI